MQKLHHPKVLFCHFGVFQSCAKIKQQLIALVNVHIMSSKLSQENFSP